MCLPSCVYYVRAICQYVHTCTCINVYMHVYMQVFQRNTYVSKCSSRAWFVGTSSAGRERRWCGAIGLGSLPLPLHAGVSQSCGPNGQAKSCLAALKANIQLLHGAFSFSFELSSFVVFGICCDYSQVQTSIYMAQTPSSILLARSQHIQRATQPLTEHVSVSCDEQSRLCRTICRSGPMHRVPAEGAKEWCEQPGILKLSGCCVFASECYCYKLWRA